MENMNEQKNNIQEKALNIDLEKQSSEHYSNQNDSTTIIQENSANLFLQTVQLL